MGNRRLGTRNKFKMSKNYIVPFICILVTCIISIFATIVILHLVKENNYYKQKLEINENSNDVVVGKNINLSTENILQINKKITYIMSNLNSGLDLNSEQAKYEIVCKYFVLDNSFDEILEEYIDTIDPEVYREIGYIYFDDLKDKYLCISKTNYDNTYSQLFNIDKQNKSFMDKYYIKYLDSYVVPKDTQTNSNKLYKATNFVQDDKNTDMYKITFSEVNLYKMYEQKEYEEIQEYINNGTVENDFLTGQTLNVNMIKKNDIFVFDSYAAN